MLRSCCALLALIAVLTSLGCADTGDRGAMVTEQSRRDFEQEQMQAFMAAEAPADSDSVTAGGIGGATSPATQPHPAMAPAVELRQMPATDTVVPGEGMHAGMSGDKHDHLPETRFASALDNPLSTFSIDVDTASYSKTRMYLLENRALPPVDAVRIEELVNYFHYDYTEPDGEHPFTLNVEVAEAPWCPEHRLARVGLKGKEIEQQRPSSNLVFVLDVSGSMDRPNKLPLVKQGMNMLTSQLTENDRVAIVVYAGAAGLVLPSTLGSERHEIQRAIDRLHAGGSTNGGEGIRLAYKTARENFLKGGVNRVILCTDGDFNVGKTSRGELVRLAEENADHGVYLSVLGFGMGNHNDAMLEELSNKADGNYAFIDNLSEARKVLVEQMSSTLVTIAKDVKIQVEFNPAQVDSYRLIGYENRRLAARDFNDDMKDAGEIGAGHTVTALYELVPAKSGAGTPGIDPLKYQEGRTVRDASDELMTVKLRYKRPDEEVSQKIELPVLDQQHRFGQATGDFRFAAAVAGFGMLLRDSEHRGDVSFAAVEEIATAARGEDEHGYRDEFLNMVRAAGRLAGDGRLSSVVAPTIHSAAPPIIVHTPHAPPRQARLDAILVVVIGVAFVLGVVITGIAVGICRWWMIRERTADNGLYPAKPPIRTKPLAWPGLQARSASE